MLTSVTLLVIYPACLRNRFEPATPGTSLHWNQIMLDALAMPAAADTGADTGPDTGAAAAVVHQPGRQRLREKPRCRYQPGTREVRALVGKRKDRMAFLESLARHGDPAVAADRLGLPLFVLFRHRDSDPAFAAEWLAAVNYAWERVESRVLAALLGDGDDTAAAEARAAKSRRRVVGSGTGQIDIRLALAIVNRRDKPVTHTGNARPADGAGAARLRAELRALAGLADSHK